MILNLHDTYLDKSKSGDSLKPVHSKAELSQEGTFFRTQFPSLGIFVNKKVGNPKN